MPRYTPARQQSDIRVTTLCAEFWRAVGVVRGSDPDLTYEEILAAANQMSTRAVGFLLAADHDQLETTDG